VQSLNNIEKSECLVCRGPLEFIKNSKVDINKIKSKKDENLLKNKDK